MKHQIPKQPVRLPGAKFKAYGLASVIGLAAAMAAPSTMAGTATFDFTTDPLAAGTGIEAFGSIVNGGESPWQATTGNPGGFLVLTYSEGSQNTTVVFPDIDEGKVVTAFKFECDLRIGNPRVGDRPADGFSISFARGQDPLLADPSNNANFAAGLPEAGTTTGIAVGFDTWAGNILPDGADIEGIIVRVDNKTVLRHALPTRNGAPTDPTSLQTGPRDVEYWTNGGDPRDPAAWSTLTWQPLVVELDALGKLSVTFKGTKVLDAYQTEYFPSIGRLVLAGRTGGNDENTHIDNIRLTTTATSDSVAPSAPANVQTASMGARRVALSWGAATDDSGRAAYQVERDGTVIANSLTTTNYVDLNVKPSTAYNYRVRAIDAAGNSSAWVNVTANTVAEVEGVGFLLAEIYDNITGTTVDLLTADPKFPASPDRGRYINGLSFGDPAFGETFGDNYGVRITGVLTAPETAQYHFFVRSDDSSQFFLNTSGPALPVPGTDAPIAEETGCCNAFQEIDLGATQTTATPISLTAGQKYGFVYLVKEGGGGDWGQVAMRKVGDTTPAASLSPIRGALVSGTVDPVGASVTVTQQPQSVTTVANESVSFTAVGSGTSHYSNAVIYQWYKNGAIIPGANSPTYTIPVVSQADNGAKFKALIAVAGANVTTSEATLTVNADNKAPTVVDVAGSDSFNSLTVKFSEPVTAATAGTAANYSVSGGVTVSAATVVDSSTVRLTTSAQTPDTAYTLTVNNVADNAGNTVSSSSTSFRSWVLRKNLAKLDLYTGITGTAVDTLYSDAKWTAGPDRTIYLPHASFGETSNFGNTYGDNYGAVMKAFLIPTNSGQYDFFIRSDDASQLFLSPNENFQVPGTDTPVAEEVGCCAAFMEPGDPRTTATPITLTAGQRYALTFVVKEGGGGDWGQVAMRAAGSTNAASTLTPISDQLWYYGPALLPDVTSTNDVIVASSTNSPANEGVAKVIDNSTSTKYLNFDELNTGFTVTPAVGATVVSGLTLTSANDAQPRDPATYRLEGSNDGVIFTLITEGAVPIFPARFTQHVFSFNNTTAYKTYRLTFPTVFNATSANSMQIAEVELLGRAVGGGGTTPGGDEPAVSIARTETSISITFEGTLQSADSVAGPYSDVQGTSPLTVTPTGAAKFYRAVRR